MDVITVILLVVLVFCVLGVGFGIGVLVARTRVNHEWEERVPEIRETAIKQSRAVLAGQFSEQLAPYLPDFKYSPSEARFVGKPIDFIVFKGLDRKEPEEIIFVEVKSGAAKPSMVEKKLKEVITRKNVRWEEYRVPEGVTKQ